MITQAVSALSPASDGQANAIKGNITTVPAAILIHFPFTAIAGAPALFLLNLIVRYSGTTVITNAIPAQMITQTASTLLSSSTGKTNPSKRKYTTALTAILHFTFISITNPYNHRNAHRADMPILLHRFLHAILFRSSRRTKHNTTGNSSCSFVDPSCCRCDCTCVCAPYPCT